MVYLFDNNTITSLKAYYPDAFPKVWDKLNEAVDDGLIRSVKEVKKELERYNGSELVIEWVKEQRAMFKAPTSDELQFVGQIFAVPHFQQLIGQQQMLVGHPVADPFLIAAAHCLGGCVVTEEKAQPNAAKIPNVCKHFNVECTNLQGMMRREEWRF